MIILGDIGYLKNIRNTIRFNIARLSEDMYSYDKGTIFSFKTRSLLIEIDSKIENSL